jgi:acrylyl-CoA reductase (NADPH)
VTAVDEGGVFRALQIREAGDTTRTFVTEFTDDDLPFGDVTVEVSYSDLNFKDGRVMQSGSRIAQHFPIVPGIDFVGVVTKSTNPLFAPGDRVTANGFGLGTDRDGGLTQRTRVPGSWLVRLPTGLEDRHAAAIGTAGYTAALAVDAILDAGVRPTNGPVLVTGSGGGVGTIAIMLLADAGFEVVSSTGRISQLSDSLKALGASHVVDRLSVDGQPDLAAPTWAAVIDSLGAGTLANALSATRYGGVVVAIGLAQGVDLSTTVLPFILRGVSLLGIDSVYAPMEKRQRAWNRLADIDRDLLDSVTILAGLDDAARVSQEIVAGRVHGRVVIDVRKPAQR